MAVVFLFVRHHDCSSLLKFPRKRFDSTRLDSTVYVYKPETRARCINNDEFNPRALDFRAQVDTLELHLHLHKQINLSIFAAKLNYGFKFTQNHAAVSAARLFSGGKSLSG